MDRDGRNTKARPRSARIAIAAFECVALIVGVTLSGVTAQLLQPTQAFALNVQSASFNPTTARNGTALVLTVTTSNDVKCVRVSGDHSATQTNAASASVSNIKIDKTAPALSGAPATSANGAGWYSGDVSIHWTCTDAVSGVGTSCPANSTISGEGTGLTASASVSDLAGNSTSATSTPAVNI